MRAKWLKIKQEKSSQKKRQTQNFDLKDKQVFKQDRFDKYYQTVHYNINFFEMKNQCDALSGLTGIFKRLSSQFFNCVLLNQLATRD